LQNANLIEVIDQLARLAKINYVLDPRVASRGVTLNTYGEIKNVNPREMLEAILRINGAAMVQMGNLYRIVPLADLAHMPLKPEMVDKDIPEDERPMLNLIFLKYADVGELSKLATEFLGPDGRAWAYPSANLLLVLDSRRSMHRLMELIAMFDSDTLAKQRVKVIDVVNSRPSDLAKELDRVLKSISMSKDASGVRFVAIDRINTLIAVASNPSVFTQVEEWVRKLDIKVKSAAGKSETYVYRLKYGKAELVAGSIMSLYYSMYSPMGMGGMSGMGMYGGGGYGGGMYGGTGLYGSSQFGGGMYGGGMYGGGMYGGGMAGAGMYGGASGSGAPYGTPMSNEFSALGAASGGATGAAQSGVAVLGGSPNAVGSTTGVGTGADQTGSYLGAGYGMGYGTGIRPGSTEFGPRVMPNISDNSLLILATPEQYDSVTKLLDQLDVPPRQVLIEAQILEVTLTGAFSSGVSAYLQQRGATNPSTVPGSAASNDRKLIGAFDGTLTTLSAGILAGQSRQLFALLTAQETSGRTKVVSTPRVVATDSIAATITVGEQVPTLASSAVTSATSAGSSLFANTISNVSTGTTLSFTARINPSGVVTLQIDQQVSAPIAPAASASIQSPSFSNREVKTQVTVQDGDMVAIGGIISEEKTESSSGIPILHKLPFIGGAFGTKSSTKTRTEMVIFITPHVIYDTNGLSEASDDLINGMKRVQKLVRE
jgi:general secretion pathway protein D